MLSLDTGALGASLIVVLVAIAAYYLNRQHFLEWETGLDEDGKPRGYAKLAGQWPMLFQISGAVGAFAAFVAYVHTNGLGVGVQSYASLTVGIFAFFMTFMGWTDLYTMKAPKEMSNMCFWLLAPLGLVGTALSNSALPHLPLPFFFSNPYADHWVQLVLTLFLFGGLLYLVPGILLGFGDVIALFIAIFAFGPMVGFFPVLWLFGFAAVVQTLLLFIFAPLFGWGVKVEDPLKKYRLKINALWTRLTKSQKELIRPYNSRMAPLLPAIGFAYVLGGIFVPGIVIF
jgi:hypothetical protein